MRKLLVLSAALVLWALPAAAESSASLPATRDMVAPQPSEPAAIPDEDGVFQVVVFGDSLADGIWTGVYRSLRRDDRFEVVRHTRVSSGLSRPDFYDWPAELDAYLERRDVDAAIISVGLNDAQPVFHDGRWEHDFGSDPWNEIYRERVSAVMRQLAEADVPAFWIGLPTVRSSSFGAKIAHINEIYREMAERHGVTFVPTHEITADEAGEYSAYLADETGRSRLVRANDGVHFTTRGYEMLAAQLLAAMDERLALFAEADADE